MDRGQGDVGESFDSYIAKFPEPKPLEPKSPDDASVVANRIPTSMPQRRSLFPAAAQEESARTCVKASWCSEQYNSAQHWSVCINPRKVSPTLLFKEFANHLPSNLDAFRCNYSTVAFKSLTTGRWYWQIMVVLLVCATLKLHNRADKATFRVTEIVMLGDKNHKLLVGAPVATPVHPWIDGPWSPGPSESPRPLASSEPL
ncbi:hypothetical protein MRX96_015788 [Rhipicephalus microplus]